MNKDNVDGPLLNSESAKLDVRVDEIMGAKKIDDIKPAITASPTPPIDIFAGRKTSPEVSAKVLKDISDVPEIKASHQEDKPDDENKSDEPEPLSNKVELNENKEENTASTEKLAESVLPKTDTKEFKRPDDLKKHKNIFKKKWMIALISFVFLLIAIAAVPFSRYYLLSLFLKETVVVNVIDSKTSSPVSNAVVVIDDQSAKTDSNGKVTLKVPVGKATVGISKQYFTSYKGTYFVGLKSGQATKIQLVATGRQVQVTVLNRITGSPLIGAEVAVLDTTAKTNSKGQASIVLPTKNTTESIAISAAGYNSAQFKVQITDKILVENTFNLTPAGQIYFLSNLSGKLDVVKSDLDGGKRQTVLAGTGSEDPNSTILMASRDWKYVVLKSIRNTAKPALYLIDTATDTATNFDSGNATFTLIGWAGNNFVYDVIKDSVLTSQPGHQSLKGYNADNGQLNLLDQNQAEGSSTTYAYEAFYNFIINGSSLAYTTQWYSGGTGAEFDLTSKTNAIRSVQANGQAKKDLQTFPAANNSYTQAVKYKPQNIYYAVYTQDYTATFYELQNSTVSVNSSINQATFSNQYPTYLTSPLGVQSFWSELRDGKKTIFVGDQNGVSPKQIASLSEYTPYGWFSDNYLLLAKNNSELYVTTNSPTSDKTPLKITDYYKPAITYNGYAGQ